MAGLSVLEFGVRVELTQMDGIGIIGVLAQTVERQPEELCLRRFNSANPHQMDPEREWQRLPLLTEYVGGQVPMGLPILGRVAERFMLQPFKLAYAGSIPAALTSSCLTARRDLLE